MPLPLGLSDDGIETKYEFPCSEYDAIKLQLEPSASSHREIFDYFSSGWNAVAYRYLSMLEHGDSFTKSISSYGSPPDVDVRYRQEKDLYGFFTNGFSVFESAFYALYAIGALIEPDQFPVATDDDQRRISPPVTVRKFAKTFSGSTAAHAIGMSLEDTGYRELRDVRNVLSHRSAPGRQIYVAIDGTETLPDEWKLLNITLNENTVKYRITMIDYLLCNIIRAMSEFVGSNISGKT